MEVDYEGSADISESVPRGYGNGHCLAFVGEYWSSRNSACLVVEVKSIFKGGVQDELFNIGITGRDYGIDRRCIESIHS